MWTQTLRERYDAGYALANAIHESLPPESSARIDAGVTLLMAALSMPDRAPRAVALPTRLTANSVGIGDCVLHVLESDQSQGLAIRVEPIKGESLIPVETWDLANFVGQTVMLRAAGENEPVGQWFRDLPSR